MVEESPFLPIHFERIDGNDDGAFYKEPRLVVHIDNGAIAAIGEFFREAIPPHAVILDLMSSWRSHWPKDHPKKLMVGLGLNAVEMQENQDLNKYVIHDLNREPLLPFDASSFDAVVITVSVQYLTRPLETFIEVNRILKTGGLLAVIFSNRMFPTKAVRIWQASNDQERTRLVMSYFHYAGNFENITPSDISPRRSPMGDPVYVVLGKKRQVTSDDMS